MLRSLSLILFSVLMATGQTYGQVLDTMIDVGRHQLHFKVLAGTGTPILFEAGNGDDGTVWEDLLLPLQELTGATLITYDRAGLGRSGIDTTKVSFKREIKDLEKGLKKLGYSKNIFLVSHSFGGVYSTLFANRNKRKVVGTVLIDVTLPCFLTEAWSNEYVEKIPVETWAIIKEHKLGLYYVLSQLPSIAAYMQNKPLPEKLPATLIAAEKILPMVKPHEVTEWTQCLRSFGKQPNHRYVLAKNTAHKVWLNDKGLVIDEIVKLYQKVSAVAGRK